MTRFVLLLLISLCGLVPVAAEPPSVERWGTLPDQREVQLFRLQEGDVSVLLSDYGAMLVEVQTADRSGQMAIITPRLDSLADYLQGQAHMGTTIGRFANRIGGGGFEIDGTRYDLQSLSPRTEVQLHGGKNGFASQLWASQLHQDGVTFSLVSPDGEEGYPGEVEVTVRYTLMVDRLRIDYRASSTKPTHVNLTNHVYWNLSGATSGSIQNHQLRLAAQQMLEFDQHKVPTGKMTSVAGTAFDFGKDRRIGEAMNQAGGGYDHCFVLIGDPGHSFAASLSDPASGRTLELWTSQAALQMYTGNHFSDKRSFAGVPYRRHGGIALEAQAYPDAPNRPEFPSTLLRPDETYAESIEFRFGTD